MPNAHSGGVESGCGFFWTTALCVCVVSCCLREKFLRSHVSFYNHRTPTHTNIPLWNIMDDRTDVQVATEEIKTYLSCFLFLKKYISTSFNRSFLEPFCVTIDSMNRVVYDLLLRTWALKNTFGFHWVSKFFSIDPECRLVQPPFDSGRCAIENRVCILYLL